MDIIKDVKEMLNTFFKTDVYGEYMQISPDTFQLAAEMIVKHVKERANE